MPTVMAGSPDGIVLESYPLSPLQHGMLFRTLLAPRAGTDVEQVVCRMREPLDAGRLEDAWRTVVRRHPVLRTRFRWSDAAEPVQEVVADAPPEIVRLDCAADCAERGLERFLEEDRARGFDLAAAPAMRLALFP